MQKTFFFRNNYTIKEMFDRIYASDFIDYFKEYAAAVATGEEESVETNKHICYEGLFNTHNMDESQIYLIMENAFNEIGRKGDKLNVKIYSLDRNYQYHLTEEIKKQIDDLKNNNENLKNLNHLSSGLKYDLYLDDIVFQNEFVDFKFKMDTFTYISEPIPSKVIHSSFIEARFYLSTKLVAVFNPNGNQKQYERGMLKVIHLLFKPYELSVSEILFDEAQLIMIQLRLNGQVSSPKLRSHDDIRVEIHGINEINYENPIVQMVNGSQSLQIYELLANCLVHGHRFNLRLTYEGRIQIESFVLPSVLDKIISDIEWVIVSKDYYYDVAKSVEVILRKKAPAMLKAQKISKIKSIQDDLLLLVNTHKTKNMQEREAKLVSTILFNISQLFADKDINDLLSDEIKDFDIKAYENLKHYLTDYIVIFKKLNRNQADDLSEKIIKLQIKLCKESTGDAVKLIDLYEQLIRE